MFLIIVNYLSKIGIHLPILDKYLPTLDNSMPIPFTPTYIELIQPVYPYIYEDDEPKIQPPPLTIQTGQGERLLLGTTLQGFEQYYDSSTGKIILKKHRPPANQKKETRIKTLTDLHHLLNEEMLLSELNQVLVQIISLKNHFEESFEASKVKFKSDYIYKKEILQVLEYTEILLK